MDAMPMNTLEQTFATAVYNARMERGWTQVQLATHASCHKNHVKKTEAGEASSVSKLGDILDVLHLTVIVR